MKSKLTKSRTEKMIAGVCGGIAEFFGWDPTLVRIAFIILTFVFTGFPILIYLLLMFIMPDS